MCVRVRVCVSYPPRHGGVGPLFELGVRGEAVPHDVGGVVLVPQLWAALKQEVYDEEFDAAVEAWNRGEKEDSVYRGTVT